MCIRDRGGTPGICERPDAAQGRGCFPRRASATRPPDGEPGSGKTVSPGRHVLVSSLVATGCGVLWQSPAAAAAAFVGGTAIDVDHFIDFHLNRMGPFTWNRFVDVCSGFRLRRLYLVLHSLEVILPCLAWAFILSLIHISEPT